MGQTLRVFVKTHCMNTLIRARLAGKFVMLSLAGVNLSPVPTQSYC